MLHFFWVDIPSKPNVVHCHDFQLTVFQHLLYCQNSFELLITLLSLLAIFAELSTFQNFDLHLEFSSFKGICHGRVVSVGDLEPEVPISIPSCGGYDGVPLCKAHILALYWLVYQKTLNN